MALQDFFLNSSNFHTRIKSGDFIGCNSGEKSKPITGMSRNELVNVRGGGSGWGAAEADIPRASTLIGSLLRELMGSFRR